MPDARQDARFVQTPEGVSPEDVLLTISSLSGMVLEKKVVELNQYAGQPSGLSVPKEPFVIAAADGPLGFRCGTDWQDQHALRLHVHRRRCKRGPLCPFWGCSAASTTARAELSPRERRVPKSMLRAYCAYHRKATHAAAVCLGREFEYLAEASTYKKRKLEFLGGVSA